MMPLSCLDEHLAAAGDELQEPAMRDAHPQQEGCMASTFSGPPILASCHKFFSLTPPFQSLTQDIDTAGGTGHLPHACRLHPCGHSCNAGGCCRSMRASPAARRPMRPADMLSRLRQHLLRMRHITSLAFGHRAEQSAAPL